MLRRLASRDEGHSLIEFGLVALLFMTVLFGAIDLARVFHAYHFVDHAARQATRYAIVHSSRSPSPASASDIDTFVRNNLALGLAEIATASCSGSPPPASALCVTTTWLKPDNTPGTNIPGNSVQVRVQYSLAPVFWRSRTVQLISTSRMVVSY